MTDEEVLESLADGRIGFANENTPEWCTVRDMAKEILGYREVERRIREWRDGAHPLNFAGGIFDEPDMQDVTRKLREDSCRGGMTKND